MSLSVAVDIRVRKEAGLLRFGWHFYERNVLLCTTQARDRSLFASVNPEITVHLWEKIIEIHISYIAYCIKTETHMVKKKLLFYGIEADTYNISQK